MYKMFETIYFALSHSLGGVQAELGPYCELRCTVWVHGLGNLQVFWFRAAPLTFWGVYLVPNTFLWEADIVGFVGFGWLVGQSCGFLVCLFVGWFFCLSFFFHMRCLDFPLGCKKKSALFHFHLYVHMNYQSPRSKDSILYQCAVRNNTFGKHKCRFYSSLFYTAVTWK